MSKSVSKNLAIVTSKLATFCKPLMPQLAQRVQDPLSSSTARTGNYDTMTMVDCVGIFQLLLNCMDLYGVTSDP